ncbi:hypothetical protein VNO80_28800 [Phaseolus coccineus]|uniref:Uncharacterized protein n=1 Tax=Phaseolus coccineus TaxID=3886 RepID=A0AAN9LD78_PHACN
MLMTFPYPSVLVTEVSVPLPSLQVFVLPQFRDIWFCASVFCCLLCSVLVPLQCPPRCCDVVVSLRESSLIFKPSSSDFYLFTKAIIPNWGFLSYSVVLCLGMELS